MTEKRTLVLGASLKTERYSNRAVKKLISHGIPVIAVGLREGEIGEVRVQRPCPEVSDIDTVTVYVGPKYVNEYTDYILKINPRRVIFNPGAGSSEIEKKLLDAGIRVVHDCTLIMLDSGTY